MLELLRLQIRTARMMTEAQTVIGLRMLGMAGVTTAAPDENARMIAEKQKAFAQSAIAATTAMLAGKTPAQVYGRALTPIGRATRSNSRRLGRHRPS